MSLKLDDGYSVDGVCGKDAHDEGGEEGYPKVHFEVFEEQVDWECENAL